MPNLAAALKAEISRLARRELRKEIQGLRKAVTTHRSEIASLKKKLADHDRAIKRVPRSKAAEAPSAAPDSTGVAMRFSAKGFAAQRKRLELSAPDLALLFGVSSQTIYNWEGGIARPYPKHMAAIAALRTLGKREAASLVAKRKEAA